MPSNSSGFNLEENLVLSNEELTSNISKLTSFIRSYEGGTWENARNKARKLLKDKTAFEYIDQVRATVSGTEKPKPEIKVSTPAKSKPINQQTVYEKNYDKLMAIAPGLEDKLENYEHDSIYGKSVKTGYMDFNLEVLDRDKTGFYIAISHYYEQNGDLVPDPDMEIFVNTTKKTVEALHFQDAYHYVEVYPDKRNRDLFSKHQKKDQNDFLADWLKNLKNQGHKIKWDEGETTGVPPTVTPTTPPVKKPDGPSSIIVDEYNKEEKKAEEKKPEPTVESKSESVEKKEEAKIISLPKENLEHRQEGLRKFISIVAFQEIGMKVKADDVDNLNDRVNHILEHQGASDYLVRAWYKLKKENHERLKELNFYRLTLFAPDVYDLLNESGEKLRLVSEKSKEAFSIELGDNRKPNAKILAVYQLRGKENVPTLLLKVDEPNSLLTVDLVFNGFHNMPKFNADEPDTDLEFYQSSIEVENWLKFLKENEYRVIVTDLKPDKGDSDKEEKEPERKFSKNYINADIPYFEPGHVQLTEAHKERGVTQKMIDFVNEHKRNILLIPAKSPMVDNTKSVKLDKKKKAQGGGLRLTKTGRFDYENRSNRADKTKRGL